MDTENISLTSLTEKLGDLSAEETVRIVRQLCDQLGTNPDNFHGNVWPANINLDEDGNATLGDAFDSTDGKRTAPQVEYTAPETFWEDGAGNASSDVYSLGMLLYAGVNGGYLPFQPKGGALMNADRSGALRKRMKGETIPMPSGISKGLSDVMTRALAYIPAERFASPGGLLAALNETEEAQSSVEDGLTAPAEPAFMAAAAGMAAASGFDGAEDGEFEKEYPQDGSDADSEWSNETGKVWDEEAEAAAAVTGGAAPAARRYTVQKDFDSSRRRSVSAVPATRRRKKRSALVPVLCVLAAAAIGGTGWYYFFGRNIPEEPEVSEAFVVIPVENPDSTEAPKPLTTPTAAPAAQRSGSLIDIENEVVNRSDSTGTDASATNGDITGVTVPAGSNTAGTIPGMSAGETSVTPSGGQAAQPLTPPGMSGNAQSGAAPATTAPAAPAATLPPVGSPTIDGSSVQSTSDTVYVTGSTVNLRSGPGTSYDVETTVKSGEALQRTGTVNGWSQIQLNGKEYYISNTLVTTTAPAGSSATPAGTQPAGSGTITPSGTAASGSSSGSSGTASVTETMDLVTITGSSVNLRSGPGTGYSVVATLPQNTILQRTGTSSGWNRVKYGGEQVYISADYSAAISDEVVVAAVGTLKVTSDVNVRSGPSTNDTIYYTARTGDSLTATGSTKNGKWYRISYNGGDAYVYYTLVESGNFAVMNDTSGTAKVTTTSNIRSGPSTDYSIQGVVTPGTTLTVTGYADTGWYRVNYNSGTGYIASNLVEITG